MSLNDRNCDPPFVKRKGKGHKQEDNARAQTTALLF
jgi:hypothetical protein